MLCTSLAAASALSASAANDAERLPDGARQFRCISPAEVVKHLGATKRGLPSPSKWDNADGHDLRGIPTDGKQKALVILISFSDKDFVVPDAHGTFTDMLNKEGFDLYGATGSARDFYVASSAGQYLPDFDVYGPVKMPKPSSYYGEDMIYSIDMHPAEMVVDACKALDGEINFADYDTNGDGEVDNIYVFYAGKGQTTGGAANTIWPHAARLSNWYVDNDESKGKYSLSLDGVTIDRYAMSCEINRDGILSGIGTFCHEFGHVLGLPDLYDTANNGQVSKCYTPNYYSTMDLGNYNNDEHTPVLFSSYERYALEWLKPYVPQGGGRVTLLPTAVRNNALKFPISNTGKPTEYFLLEARAREGWDKYLPGEGLMVWHIEYGTMAWEQNKVNNNEKRQLIDLIEADDDQFLATDHDDLFPGGAGTYDYEYDSTPSLQDWDRQSLPFRVLNIEQLPDGAIAFNLLTDDGKEDPALAIEAPEAEIKALTANSVKAEWNAVEGADSYRVSVVDATTGDVVARHIESEGTSIEIDGLKPATGYRMLVYACNDLNTATSQTPLTFATPGTGADSRPVMIASTRPDGATLTWTPAEGASAYRLTVATRSTGAESDSETAAFDGKKLPEGWTFNGKYDERDRYSATAPSACLSLHTEAMQTKIYEKPIRGVSLWTRFAFNDEEAISTFDIYGLDRNGAPFLLNRTRDVAGKQEGTKIELEFTRDVYGLRFVNNILTSGQSLYIDDVRLSFTDGHTDSPLADYNAVEVSDTRADVAGLEEGKTYVAYVEPVDGTAAGLRSEALEFVARQSTGVIEIPGLTPAAVRFAVADGLVIPTDMDMEYNVYTTAGIRVASDTKGTFRLPARGIYIIRCGASAAKVVW